MEPITEEIKSDLMTENGVSGDSADPEIDAEIIYSDKDNSVIAEAASAAAPQPCDEELITSVEGQIETE